MDVLKIFIVGVVTIGIATAVLAPGRQTVNAIGAAGKAASGLLSTAETGK